MMLKLFSVISVSLATLSLLFSPAMAEEAASWKFYGSSRMMTWYTNGDDMGSGAVDYFGVDPDGAETTWNLQSNSRIGARVTSGNIGGRFEYGTGVNLRLLYGTYTMGDHRFLAGQAYTPLAWLGYSGQSVLVDEGLLAVGHIYNGRDPMLEWTYKGLRLALVTPAGSDFGGDKDVTLPAIEALYGYKAENFFVDIFGGYQTYEVENFNEGTEDETIDAYTAGIGGGTTVGPLALKAMEWLSRNAGELGIANVSQDSPIINDSGELIDNDGLAGAITLKYKATDTVALEAGFGYAGYELDASNTNKDEAMAYYLQAVIDIAPGFFIVPEFGYYDFMEDQDGLDEGTITYFGLKWQINF